MFDHVLLDAGIIIKCDDLLSIGQNLYITDEVHAELKDNNSRRKLTLISESLQNVESDVDCVKEIMRVAKETGDYGSLSPADLGVLAAALHLHKRYPDYIDGSSVETDDAAHCIQQDDVLEEEEEEKDQNDEGWVTSDNLSQVLNSGCLVTSCSDAPSPSSNHSRVACATTDFAVQNVCAKLGIALIGADGRQITEVRTYVLWCCACMNRCLKTNRRFCPKCGNETLQKITAKLEKNGQLQLFFKKNYQYRLRGTRFSLPTPKGGKHTLNPVLSEGQPVPQQRLSKKQLQATNPFMMDEAIDNPHLMSSPFAVHDLTSRAAVLGVKQMPAWTKRNPNESRKRTGKRKK